MRRSRRPARRILAVGAVAGALLLATPHSAFASGGTIPVTGWTPQSGNPGAIDAGAYPEVIGASGRYAFTTDTGDRIAVIDSDAAGGPVVIGHTPAAGSPGGMMANPGVAWMAAVGTYLYTANNVANSISSIDISNPASPVVVGTTPADGTAGGLSAGPAPRTFAVSGSLLYVANYASENIDVVDISNPSAPTRVGSSPAAGSPGGLTVGSLPNHIVVSGPRAYVTTATEGIAVLDLSIPTAPVVIGALPSKGTLGGVDATADPYRVAVSGSYVYLATQGYSSVYAINVSDPAHPTIAGELPARGAVGGPMGSANSRFTAIAAVGSVLLLNDANNVFTHVLDISTPTAPVVTASTAPAGTPGGYRDPANSYPFGIAVSGTRAYSMDYGDNTVAIIDISAYAPPSSSPSGSVPAAASATASATATASAGRTLPSTGASVLPWLIVGAGLVVGGAGVIAARAGANARIRRPR